ncbi:MAG: hypothetical protein WCO84_09745 [bacterium]
MNIFEVHIQNIINQNNLKSFEISELNFESRITPGVTPDSHLLISENLNNGICFKIHSILYWFNVGTALDSTDWSNLHLPQLHLVSDKTKAFIKVCKFDWNWLGPISTPLEYDFLCNAKGQLELSHYNPSNADDTAFFISFHKLFIINPR